MRRVEALVGADAYKFLAREHILLNSLTTIIKGARVEELPGRISELLTKMREIEKELGGLRSVAAFAKVDEIAQSAVEINGVTLIAAVLSDGISGDDLRKIALELRARATSCVVALISVNDGKPVLVVGASDAARAQGVKAGALVKIGSTVLGGGGGGKDDFAQGGGIDISQIHQVISAITAALKG